MPARCLRGFWLVLLFTSLLIALPSPLAAQAVRYEYDALGRLTVVSTPEGVALYEYDAVGNILRITTHRYTEASGPVAILAVSPDRGAPGIRVTLYGKGFAPTPADNQVAFNGVAAAVTAATGSTLTTVVPPGATTGPVTLTTAQGTATSPGPFTVLVFAVVPAEASVSLGGTLGFQATLDGTPQSEVTWRVNGIVGGDSTVGTISPSGLYTAPTTLPPTQPLQVEALRGGETGQGATASLRVVSQIGGVGAAAPITVGRAPRSAPVASPPLAVGPVPRSGPLASGPLSVGAGPVVDALAPASATVSPTTLTLTLTGRNLQGATGIRILFAGRVDGQFSATTVTATDDTRVICTLTIQSGADAGPRVLQVLTPYGMSTDLDMGANRFTLIAP